MATFAQFTRVNSFGSSQQGYHIQDSSSIHQDPDPNSPQNLKQNIQLVGEQVLRLQDLIQRIIGGIENAYLPGNNPAQVEADLQTLKQSIRFISEMMRHTGVGALPLIPLPQPTTGSNPTGAAAGVINEEQLLASTSQASQNTFERLQRRQDGAAVVANLLSQPELGSRSSLK